MTKKEFIERYSSRFADWSHIESDLTALIESEVARKKEPTDDQYIEVYDRMGHKTFHKGSDTELKAWGNSEEKIREIKVKAVKFCMGWDKDGRRANFLMNEILGGKNALPLDE